MGQRFDNNIATKDLLKTYEQLEEGQVNSKRSNNIEKHKYTQPLIEILNKYKNQSKPKKHPKKHQNMV